MSMRVVVAITVVVTSFLLVFSVSKHSVSGLEDRLEDKDREIVKLKGRLKESLDCESQLMKALEDAVLYKEMAENCVDRKIRVRSR